MSSAVLDSSAVLAVLFAEAGAERVDVYLPGALLSAVNAGEVAGVLVDRGMTAAQARFAIEESGVRMIDFTFDQACKAGELRTATRKFGLSLGDRACLALALERGLPAITADRIWASVPGFNVVLIRS